VPIILSAVVQGCQVQLVSPYSADVQKRASDMISEVSAWELQMRDEAGTPEGDPRNPNIRAQFAKWDGQLEAMVAVEAALNPEIIQCDRLAGAVTQSSKVIAEQAPPVTRSSSSSAGAITHQSCETQVFQNLQQTLMEMQQVVQHQCELPWLTEDHFQQIGDPRAVAAPQRSAVTSKANTSAPTADQQRIARENCVKIFRPAVAQGQQNTGHGVVIAPVIGQLYDIVYIETRKSTAAAKP
jgi:hypothetical protein